MGVKFLQVCRIVFHAAGYIDLASMDIEKWAEF